MAKTTDPDAQAGHDDAARTNTFETAPVPDAGQDGTVVTDPATAPEEVGGPAGPEPTRYGDWEKKGRCIDF